MMGLSMCSITMFVLSFLSAMSVTVCQMLNSSSTAMTASIPNTTYSLSVGESASSLALTPLTTF